MTVPDLRPDADAQPVLYGDRRRWGLIHGDVLDALALLPSDSVSAVVCDPPYGISIEPWDGGDLASSAGFQAFSQAWATAVHRVLRPGGHLLAFGASRTSARLAVGIEEAGFEIRDTLAWLYGSGVPKGRRMPGGLSSALKPAWEPMVLARKPLDPVVTTIAANLARHGTGALNIGASRLARGDDHAIESTLGRWPANVMLGHAASCGLECVGDCPVSEIDRRNPAARPSRFFYCAKPSRGEREAGLDGLPARSRPIFSGSGGRPRRNTHRTVKPQDLMRWLVRLVVPASGVVLDPFSGSGSTGIAAVLEGRQFVGIEREHEYVRIASARIRHWAIVAERQRAA